LTEVDDNGSMLLLGAALEWPRAPAVGQIGAEQYQVSGAVVSDAVAHQPLPVAAHNEGKFVLRVVVPKKRESGSNALERRKWFRATRQFFKARSHMNIVNKLSPNVKSGRSFVPMECICWPTWDKTVVDFHGYDLVSSHFDAHERQVDYVETFHSDLDAV
jgi:hypothetical protein